MSMLPNMINLHIYPSSMENESRIFREANFIEKLGKFSVIQLAGVATADLPSEQNISSVIQIKRFKRNYIWATLGIFSKILNNLIWYICVYHYYRQKNVGLINCHSLPVLWLCCILAKKTGAKLIYDTHELETETMGLSGFRQKVSKWIERKLIYKVDHVICVGYEIQKWYKQEYSLENIDVVLNCPDKAKIDHFSVDQYRKLYDIPETSMLYLYQGLLSSGRGLELIIDAFTNVDNASVVLMGYGPLKDMIIAAASTNKNIHYHPAVPPNEVLAYTAQADYGLSIIEPVAVSYDYCMPNKLFEYIACGIPLIVSNTKEQAAIVEKYQIGKVMDSFSSESLKNLLCNDFDVLNSYKQNISQIQETFSWSQQEIVLADIYNKL